MPDGQWDREPVTYGRWAEAHQALTNRVTRLEEQAGATAGAAIERTQMADQITELRGTMDARRNRTWTLATLILAGLALPVIVLLIGKAVAG